MVQRTTVRIWHAPGQSSATCHGSDKATPSIERVQRLSSFELLITSHPDKRLVFACKQSLRRSDEAVVQRVRYRRREICYIHPELPTFDIRKCKDEAIKDLRTCRWRISVFSAPGSCYHGAVIAIGSQDFAVSSNVAAEVFVPFGIDRIEPDDAVWTEGSVAPVP